MDKYTWVDFGDSYLPSELNAAYLWGQLEQADAINKDRLHSWDRYYMELLPLKEQGKLELPEIPEGCVHNAHMFYVKLRDLEERTDFITFMKDKGVSCSFHYVPLHSATSGFVPACCFLVLHIRPLFCGNVGTDNCIIRNTKVFVPVR